MFECIKKLFSKKPVATPTPLPPPEAPKPIDPIGAKRNLKKGLDLIKEFEGCVLHAYPDPGTGGAPWTIGWGHTGSDVYPGKKITQAEADILFEQDIQPRIRQVEDLIKVPVNDNQFGALLSFAYNCGVGALGGSNLLKYLNSGSYDLAANQFQFWNRGANGVLPGLVRRRKAERDLFLS